MPASAAIRITCSAIYRACFSLSITQGPAIRKSGLPPPRRSEPRGISRGVVIRSIEDSTGSEKSGGTGGGKPPHPRSCGGVGYGAKNGSSRRVGGRCVLSLGRGDSGGSRGPCFLLLVLQRRTDESRKKRMRLQRFGLELRVELAPQEPGMLRRLDDLHVILVWRAPGDAQAGPDERSFVIAIEFVTVPVALADFQCPEAPGPGGPGPELEKPPAQPHGPAHSSDHAQISQLINDAVRRPRI